jgi:hypothetical protein
MLRVDFWTNVKGREAKANATHIQIYRRERTKNN